jgi:hypothetical protein
MLEVLDPTMGNFQRSGWPLMQGIGPKIRTHEAVFWCDHLRENPANVIFSDVNVYLCVLLIYVTCRIFCAKGITVSQIFCELLHFEMLVLEKKWFLYIFEVWIKELYLNTINFNDIRCNCIRGASLLKKYIFFFTSPFSQNFAWRLWPGSPIDGLINMFVGPYLRSVRSVPEEAHFNPPFLGNWYKITPFLSWKLPFLRKVVRALAFPTILTLLFEDHRHPLSLFSALYPVWWFWVVHSILSLVYMRGFQPCSMDVCLNSWGPLLS